MQPVFCICQPAEKRCADVPKITGQKGVVADVEQTRRCEKIQSYCCLFPGWVIVSLHAAGTIRKIFICGAQWAGPMMGLGLAMAPGSEVAVLTGDDGARRARYHWRGQATDLAVIMLDKPCWRNRYARATPQGVDLTLLLLPAIFIYLPVKDADGFADLLHQLQTSNDMCSRASQRSACASQPTNSGWG